MNIIDEYTRECLCCYVGRDIRWQNAQEQLTNVFFQYGVPEYICSDNGSEFTAINLREWLSKLEVGSTYIEP